MEQRGYYYKAKNIFHTEVPGLPVLKESAVTLMFLFYAILIQAQITIRVVEIPKSIPDDLNLFITGTMNGWDPGNNEYKLSKKNNGTYETPMIALSDTKEND